MGEKPHQEQLAALLLGGNHRTCAVGWLANPFRALLQGQEGTGPGSDAANRTRRKRDVANDWTGKVQQHSRHGDPQKGGVAALITTVLCRCAPQRRLNGSSRVRRG